jgi:lipoprotein
MKKIIFFVLGMLFLSSCGNGNDNFITNVAVAPENRESFLDNPYFSSDDFKNSYDYERLENIRIYFENQSVEDYLKKKTQYNTFKEAIEKSFNWDKKVLKEILEDEENVESIKKIEKIAKSKFFLVKETGSPLILIYFTAVTPNEFGESGKYNIIKVNFNRGINSVENINFPILLF